MARQDVRGLRTRLTSTSGLNADPALSPDGRLLAYASIAEGTVGFFDPQTRHRAAGLNRRIGKRSALRTARCARPMFPVRGRRMWYGSPLAELRNDEDAPSVRLDELLADYRPIHSSHALAVLGAR